MNGTLDWETVKQAKLIAAAAAEAADTANNSKESVIMAGTTQIPVNTKIRIVNSDDEDMIGLEGKITHPFAGLKCPNTNYIAGLYIDPTMTKREIPFAGKVCNLMPDDIIEVIEP